jgi:hypothetical protein
MNKTADTISAQRLRRAKKKLKEARGRAARAERSVAYWTRLIADLHYETVLAVQLPLLSVPDLNQVEPPPLPHGRTKVPNPPKNNT